MKTNFYVVFTITNKETRNFLISVFETNDENLIKVFKSESMMTNDQPTLHQYVFDHPKSYNHIKSFVNTLNYFTEGCFDTKFLGSYIEKSDADQRVELTLDSFKRNYHSPRFYFNDCYNVHKDIANETEAQQQIGSLSENIKKKSEELDRNNRSIAKKQDITIVDNESGEEHYFETKGECMKFLGCATDTFSRFLKGNTKLNKKYTVKQKDSLIS